MLDKLNNNKDVFEEEIFKISTLYIIAFTIVSLIVDLLIVGYGILQQYYSINLVLFILIYLISYKVKYSKLIFPLVFVGLSTIISVWFLNGGVSGIAPYLLISFFLIVLIISPINQRMIYFLILIIIFFILILIEGNYSDLILNPTPIELRSLELSISIFIVLNATFLLIIKFLNKYEDSKQILNDNAEEINLNNIQLEKLNNELNLKIEELNYINNLRRQIQTIIVHDIKGPVTSVINGLEMLKEPFDDNVKEKDDRNFYNSIIDSTKQVNLVVDNILVMSQIENNSLQLNNEIFSLKMQLDEILKLVNISANIKNIKIINNIGEGNLTKFDKIIFTIILRNIIYNSIKYSNKDSEIIINIIENEYEYEIVVKDSGIGMNTQLIENIYKGINLNKPNNDSIDLNTGFGFKIIQTLIKIANQSFRIESELEKGTKVYFTLPKFKTND